MVASQERGLPTTADLCGTTRGSTFRCKERLKCGIFKTLVTILYETNRKRPQKAKAQF